MLRNLWRPLLGIVLGLMIAELVRSTQAAPDYVAFAERHRRLFAPAWTIIQLRDADATYEAFAAGARASNRATGPSLCANKEIPHERTSMSWRFRQPSMLAAYAVVRVQEYEEAACEPPLFRSDPTNNAGPPSRPGRLERTLSLSYFQV